MLSSDEVKAQAASLTVNALLAATGGFVDGFTYVGHGRVFANGMTANVLLFSASLFTGLWPAGLRFLPPIVAFMAAVWVSQAIHLRTTRSSHIAPYRAVLILETGVLFTLSLLPATTSDLLFTTSIAFVAALQMQTFREVDGRTYSSTFTTGNLRTLGEAAFTWCFRGRGQESARVVRDFATIVAAFLAGALAGAGTTKAFGNRALWLPSIWILLVWMELQTGSRLAAGRSQNKIDRSAVSETSSRQAKPRYQ
jgi:uncharacterized membrane protein YoaK (UPF0700 family)